MNLQDAKKKIGYDDELGLVDYINDIWFAITPWHWLYRLPLSITRDWPREVKYAWQRVIKGYDDRCYWDLDSYLGPLIVRHLKNFRENNTHGYPGYGDVDTPEKWEATLDTMIEGWDFLADREKYEDEIVKKLGTPRKPGETFMGVELTENKFNRKTMREVNRQHKIATKKAMLFVKYFNNLWD